MKNKFILLILLLASPAILFAQQKFSISGYVKDAFSGETLIGSTVVVKELGKGVNTNEYGFYSISLPAGKYQIVASYLGFKPISDTINFNKNIKRNFFLKSNSIVSKEAIVLAEKAENNFKSTQMGTQTLQMEKVKTLPVILGEVDILKTLQLLPGVQSSGEGNSGFYVRGGGPDQNLVLLDEATVYNSGHLFGFFSVFNSDAINSVTLIKGGMPAEYGGRLSSVM